MNRLPNQFKLSALSYHRMPLVSIPIVDRTPSPRASPLGIPNRMSTGTPVVFMLHTILVVWHWQVAQSLSLKFRAHTSFSPEHTTSKQQDVPLRLTVQSVSHMFLYSYNIGS